MWQLSQAIAPKPRKCRYVEESFLLIEKSMRGATGNIYCGLLEFEDMGFVLHFLRPGDRMGDIGANVGAYTILAAKNTGANVTTVEPIAEAFAHLQNNILLNDVTQLVESWNCGIASRNGELNFTTKLDVVNHVLPAGQENQPGATSIKVFTLDHIFNKSQPILLKIDVEGFEQEAIAGAASVINTPGLQAIIIELNGSGLRYGYRDESIDEALRGCGFLPYKYDPLLRSLEVLRKPGEFNTIYVRDLDFVLRRVTSAKKFTILQQRV